MSTIDIHILAIRTVDMASLVPVNPVNLSPGLANGGIGHFLVYTCVCGQSKSFHCWHNTQAALENNMAYPSLPQLPDSLLAMLNSPDLNLSGPVFQPGLAGCRCCNLLSMGLSCWCRKTKVDACTQTEESALSVAGRFTEQDLKKTGTHTHRLLVVSYYIGSR